jgi:hypothetical protein
MTPTSPDFNRESLSTFEMARYQERKEEWHRLHVLHDKDTVPAPSWWEKETNREKS